METTKNNIYEKLQDMRCELQKMELKKSGKNKFVGYEYFELQDFIPQINELMSKFKVTSAVLYDEIATLTLYNIEKPEEKIVFSSPMSEANLKGTHPVQNLGAVETYLRRYLYITAFEIVEKDALDSTQGDGKATTATTDGNLGNCKCGAPMKLSQVGKKYCSALCWKKPVVNEDTSQENYLDPNINPDDPFDEEAK